MDNVFGSLQQPPSGWLGKIICFSQDVVILRMQGLAAMLAWIFWDASLQEIHWEIRCARDLSGEMPMRENGEGAVGGWKRWTLQYTSDPSDGKKKRKGGMRKGKERRREERKEIGREGKAKTPVQCQESFGKADGESSNQSHLKEESPYHPPRNGPALVSSCKVTGWVDFRA